MIRQCNAAYLGNYGIYYTHVKYKLLFEEVNNIQTSKIDRTVHSKDMET